jgi:hypothetical protein
LADGLFLIISLISAFKMYSAASVQRPRVAGDVRPTKVQFA